MVDFTYHVDPVHGESLLQYNGKLNKLRKIGFQYNSNKGKEGFYTIGDSSFSVCIWENYGTVTLSSLTKDVPASVYTYLIKTDFQVKDQYIRLTALRRLGRVEEYSFLDHTVTGKYGPEFTPEQREKIDWEFKPIHLVKLQIDILKKLHQLGHLVVV